VADIILTVFDSLDACAANRDIKVRHSTHAGRARSAIALCALALSCSNVGLQPSRTEDVSPRRGGTLEIVSLSDVDHLATSSAYIAVSSWILRTFTRQLVSYPPLPDSSAKLQPAGDLASEIPTRENGGISPDGRVYTFHLRTGVRWNTAPPRDVTAADVVRGFQMVCNPVSPAGAVDYYTRTIVGMAAYCERFSQVPGTPSAIQQFVASSTIDGIHTPDERTVIFTLMAPAADFLNLLALPFASAVPVEYLQYEPDGPSFRQHTISNGPYQLTRYIQNREMVFDRNPSWDATTDPIRPAYVDRIRIRLGIDEPLQQLQIQAGTADLAADIAPASTATALLDSGDPSIWLSPGEDVYGVFDTLVFNRVSPNAGRFFNRKDVRRAISMAVDRSALAQVSGGTRVARVLRQAVPSMVSGFSPVSAEATAAGDRGDPVAARRVLQEAGVPAGTRLRLAYQIFEIGSLMAQVLQSNFERIGLRVELRPMLASEFYGRLLADAENARRGEWDLLLTTWVPDWFGGVNGRSVFVPIFYGRHLDVYAQNYGLYANPAVDDAIDRALLAQTEDDAQRAWRETAALLMDDMAHVPLLERKVPYGRSRRVRNCSWTVLGFNCDLTALWLANASPANGS
jgi:ABC-type transport system substrate-binding protein